MMICILEQVNSYKKHHMKYNIPSVVMLKYVLKERNLSIIRLTMKDFEDKDTILSSILKPF